ncbi:cytochrome b5-like heme/steroid binding domain-containing protein [Halteromyces radiatus]|uniref:cytochrome b5-like heme/steroid binding domain-containing protein n=1 Tax=Halteromyces radiatus TaxID=101107 RepID=UPI0022204DDF|nr:cytochrome b5-like heme/steroid binding domain-containing protein [Halteromyces radiatus]KAI8093388.1 cytochrome b5-like heme/steroid binding domain-containing protein [Halteromyces radiatus]
MATVQRRKPQKDDHTEHQQNNTTTKNETTQPLTIGKIMKTGLTIIIWSLTFFFLASYLLTESWTWGYRGKWTNPRTYFPAKQQVFTEKELLQYDGSNPNLPIYLAIDGDVFDVTEGRGWYGHGGSYGHFSGKDAARAYVTGCFEDHLTHDLRGLSPAQLKGVDHWKSFYANHHKYHKIGTVIHPPIDPSTPIPAPCRQAVGQKP